MGDDSEAIPQVEASWAQKAHILTDKEGIPISIVISAANTRVIKLVTDVVNNAVDKRHISSLKTKEGRK